MEDYTVMVDGEIKLHTKESKEAFAFMHMTSEQEVELFVNGTRCLYNEPGCSSFQVAEEVFI